MIVYGEPATPSVEVLKLLEKVPPLTVASCVTPSSVIATVSPSGTSEIVPESVVVAVP